MKTHFSPLLNGKENKISNGNGNGNGNGKSSVNQPNKLNKELISAWLIAKLAEKLEIDSGEIDPHTDLTDYGLNSIEAVNLSGELENFLERRLPPTLLWDYPTLAELAKHLAEICQISTDKSDIENNHFIPQEYYDVRQFPEYLQLQGQLDEINAQGIKNPFFTPQEKVVNDKTTIGHQELINYATYNYLGMCGDVEVNRAAKDAIERYGTSASASRLLSGEKPLHRQLEKAIADLIGAEDSIVYVGGHATNVTTIGHLFGQKDLVLHDYLSHNSILQGCFLSGATIMSFPHNDWDSLEQILQERRHQYQRVLIVIEGVYSTDGDIPNLPKFIEVKKRHKAFLMVDEAHSIGVLGKNGRGIGELFGVNPHDVDLWMGTLSKSFASCGGYIAGNSALIEYLKYTAPGFVYSVGISPPNAAASLAAIQLLLAKPERVACLQDRSKLFLDLAKEYNLNTGLSKGSPVIPIIVGDSLKSLKLSHQLFQCGINAPFMIYPSVPKNGARLRFFITCNHTEEQIRFTVESIAQELAKME